MNNTTDSYLESDDRFYLVEKKFTTKRFLVFTLVALATYFGNTLILVSLKKFSKHLKGTLYILIGHLAIADLLLATGLTLEVIGSIFTSLEVNIYFCLVKIMITGISLSASCKLLLFISLDRFCAIMFPMKHLAGALKTRRRRIKLLLVWLLSIVAISIPVFVNFDSLQVTDDCKYGTLIPESISLIATAFILSHFAINLILCSIVMWRLRTNTMSRQKYKKCMMKCRLLITVYAVFLVCWCPFVVTTILIAVSSDKQKYMSVREYTIAPGLMNSAMNWIVYSLANLKLRSAFKNVLLCRNERELRATSYIKAAVLDKPTERVDNEVDLIEPGNTCETIA